MREERQTTLELESLAGASLQNLMREMLVRVGEDPERDGLRDTPERMERSMQYLTRGYQEDPEGTLLGAMFDVAYDEMVIVKDIEMFSLCEHHLLPFFGKVHVAYIPSGKVIGLSKVPRLVDVFARRLQVQERLTTQIADAIESAVHPGKERRLMCSVGGKPTEVKVRNLVAWIEGERETESLVY